MVKLPMITAALLTAHFGTIFSDTAQTDLIQNKLERLFIGQTFRNFIAQHVPLRPTDGKIYIPENIQHVKLDIGLSYNAPMSQHWLSQEADLLVFGFEPNPSSVEMIKKGGPKLVPGHGDPLDPNHIGKNFHLIPCALGQSDKTTTQLYITTIDCGCSSIYQPIYLEVGEVVDVPLFSLADFFDLFPFDTHPVIEYIKIDAQGADLDIVKGGEGYIQERVVFITIEAENEHYKDTQNSEHEIEEYMHSIGFIRYITHKTSDPTYLNLRFFDYVKTHDVKIYQNG